MKIVSATVYLTIFFIVNLIYWLLILPTTKFLGILLRKDTVRWYDFHCTTWGRILYKWGEVIFNVKLYVEGKEKLHKGGEYIVFSNHQSLIDIVLLFYLLQNQAPLRFIIKESLKKIPVVGTATIGAKHCFITRKNREYDIAQIKALAERAKIYPTSPVIFGDGTRKKPDSSVIGKLQPLGTVTLLESLPSHKLLDVTIEGPWIARDLKGLFNLWGATFRVYLQVFTQDEIPKGKEEKIAFLEKLWQEKEERIKRWRQQTDV